MTYKIINRWNHSKASEEHLEAIFHYDGHPPWHIGFPIKCRRAGINLETEPEITAYLESLYAELNPAQRNAWDDYVAGFWAKSRSDVTKPIFDRLAERYEWLSYDQLSSSSNPARRIQALKEAGFTIGTRRRTGARGCEYILLPKIPSQDTGYEGWSRSLRDRIFRVLRNYDAYEGKAGNKSHLLPDHKFPEIRWDAGTKRDTLENLSDADIARDFQLLSNQRNQQKREVCRKCFQTSTRGYPFGIPYFYQGTANWPSAVPKSGKEAEAGCIGCGWYDLKLWRSGLTGKLRGGQRGA